MSGKKLTRQACKFEALLHPSFSPTCSESFEPVGKHIHEQLDGENQSEKEVQFIKQNKPAI
jgi:hypothetical protein